MPGGTAAEAKRHIFRIFTPFVFFIIHTFPLFFPFDKTRIIVHLFTSR